MWGACWNVAALDQCVGGGEESAWDTRLGLISLFSGAEHPVGTCLHAVMCFHGVVINRGPSVIIDRGCNRLLALDRGKCLKRTTSLQDNCNPVLILVTLQQAGRARHRHAAAGVSD